MWPHSSRLTLGGLSVCVATDDPAVAALWAPWADRDDPHDPDALVDLGLERAVGRTGAPVRPLASLRHGSRSLGRTQDVSVLDDAFWRTLGGHLDPPAAVEIDAALVLGPAGGVLVERDVVDVLPVHALADAGWRTWPVHHVGLEVASTGTLVARLAAPLVGGGAALESPLVDWWVADAPERSAPLAEQVAARARGVASHRVDDAALDVLGLAVGVCAPTLVPSDRGTARRAVLDRLHALGN